MTDCLPTHPRLDRLLATKASNLPDSEAAKACTGSVSGLKSLAFENTSRTSAIHSFAVLQNEKRIKDV